MTTPRPAPRWRPTASISSIKMITVPLSSPVRTCHEHGMHPHREHFYEVRTGDSKERNFRFASIAFASSVLPVPGGPTIRTPSGSYRRVSGSGSARADTQPVSNFFFCFVAARNVSKGRFDRSSVSMRALLLPNDMAPLPPRPAFDA